MGASSYVGSWRRWFGCWGGSLLAVSLLCGCAKVEEMAKTTTDTSKEKIASQTSKPAPAADNAAASTSAPSSPKIDSEKVLQEFLALPSGQIADEHLTRLASMDSTHREQVLNLDLSGSRVTGAGLGKLAAFPNLAELKLAGI